MGINKMSEAQPQSHKSKTIKWIQTENDDPIKILKFSANDNH